MKRYIIALILFIGLSGYAGIMMKQRGTFDRPPEAAGDTDYSYDPQYSNTVLLVEFSQVGPVFVDYSAYGLNVISNNSGAGAATWVTDANRYSAYVHFELANRISVRDNPVLSFGDSTNDRPFSMQITYDPDDEPSPGDVPLFKLYEYRFELINGWPYVMLYDGGPANFLWFSPTLRSSIAYLGVTLTFTYDGSGTIAGGNLYLNGRAVPMTSGTNGTYTAMHDTANPVTMGAGLEGDLDHVVIWDIELTPAEVAANYYGSGSWELAPSHSPGGQGNGNWLYTVYETEFTNGLYAYSDMERKARWNSNVGYKNCGESVGKMTYTASYEKTVQSYQDNQFLNPYANQDFLWFSEDQPIFNGASEMSVSFWFSKTNVTNQGDAFSHAKGNDERVMIQCSCSDTVGVRFEVSRGSQAYGITTNEINVGDKVMATMVFNGTNVGNALRLKGYINGLPTTLQFTGTVPAILDESPEKPTFGGYKAGSAAMIINFEGYIDDMGLWTRALSDAEVWQMYTGQVDEVVFP